MLICMGHANGWLQCPVHLMDSRVQVLGVPCHASSQDGLHTVGPLWWVGQTLGVAIRRPRPRSLWCRR